MKKYVTKAAVIMAVIMMLGFAASAQTYVKIRPKAPVIEKTQAPDNHHIWVDEEWTWKKGKYRYSGGHWIDRRRGYTWVPGRWERKGRFGERWIPGHWQRVRRR